MSRVVVRRVLGDCWTVEVYADAGALLAEAVPAGTGESSARRAGLELARRLKCALEEEGRLARFVVDRQRVLVF